MSAVASRLASSIGAGGTIVALAIQPTLLSPVVVTIAALGILPLLLISTLALAAVYSPDPTRRKNAGKILDRLLGILRPPR
ncbi:MAG: hypothetical protein ACRDRW_08100 [Pseudonocardiaceae bacterium]